MRKNDMRTPEEQRRRVRTAEASKYLNLSESTLEKYRLTGSGPRYAKFGRIVTYSLEDLDTWVNARTRTSTSEMDRVG
jgi:predicted DNA-binding transcriptional regulator AlpA